MKKSEKIDFSTCIVIKIMCLIFCLVIFETIPLRAETGFDYVETVRLTIHMHNSVRNVISYIEKNSEYVFLYHEENINLDRKVKLDVNNETLIPILDKLFRGTDVEYLIKNRQIIIRRNSTLVKNNKSLIVSQEKKNLTGKVLDDNGEPLPGAAIVVKGSTRGVTTDLDGSFDIEVLPSEILVFSFLGMQDQEIKVGNQTQLVVKMLQQADELEEVTVVAFGKQKNLV